MSTISYSELTYTRPNQPQYVYPDWAVGIGWAMAGLAAITIPLTAIYNYFVFCIREQRVKNCLKYIRTKNIYKRCMIHIFIFADF